jgi:maleate cis-trans isomerase
MSEAEHIIEVMTAAVTLRDSLRTLDSEQVEAFDAYMTWTTDEIISYLSAMIFNCEQELLQIER